MQMHYQRLQGNRTFLFYADRSQLLCLCWALQPFVCQESKFLQNFTSGRSAALLMLSLIITFNTMKNILLGGGYKLQSCMLYFGYLSPASWGPWDLNRRGAGDSAFRYECWRNPCSFTCSWAIMACARHVVPEELVSSWAKSFTQWLPQDPDLRWRGRCILGIVVTALNRDIACSYSKNEYLKGKIITITLSKPVDFTMVPDA